MTGKAFMFSLPGEAIDRGHARGDFILSWKTSNIFLGLCSLWPSPAQGSGASQQSQHRSLVGLNHCSTVLPAALRGDGEQAIVREDTAKMTILHRPGAYFLRTS